MTLPTFYMNATLQSARESELPNASFSNGMNLAGSNNAAIGVNFGGGAVAGTPEQFTLLDQAAAARNPQDSQHIGSAASSVRYGTPSTTGDGTLTSVGTVALTVLATGWVAGA
tara:strand:- start:23425 stop:23763 length:339 start_codon:yes stop_codon:yes gene_type:complete